MSPRVEVTPYSVFCTVFCLGLDIKIFRRKLFGSILLDRCCILFFFFLMKNKVLTCIIMTVAFPHCCAPTVGHGYKYWCSRDVLTLPVYTQTLAFRFRSAPSNRNLPANQKAATGWKARGINAKRWTEAQHFRARIDTRMYNTPTQQLNNTARFFLSSLHRDLCDPCKRCRRAYSIL